MQTDQNLLGALNVQGLDTARDVRRRIAAGRLSIEIFGRALRVVGDGVDLIVARYASVTADDLVPVRRR